MSRPALAAIVLLLATAVQAVPPEVRFDAHRTRCVAPCDVYFDARATTDPDHAAHWQDLIDLTYAWTFGDPESGIWRHGASHHSRDIDTGFVTGHVYDRPGRYEVMLRVTDQQGETATAKTQIEVLDPDEMWPGRRTVCVRADESGGFAGCPEGAHRVTTDSLDVALRSSRFCDMDHRSSGVRCLLRRGDRFLVKEPTTPASRGHHLVGAFGRGPKPLIELAPGDVEVFRPMREPSVARTILMDLAVLGTDEKKQRFFDLDHRAGQNILIYRVDMRGLGVSVMLYAGGKKFVPGRRMPNHISIVDSTSLSNGSAVAIVFSSAEQLLMLGNDFGDKDGPQHVVRLGWADGAALSHNSLGRHCGRSHHVVKIHNHKHDETSACTSGLVLADNLIEACGDNRSDVTIQPNSNRGHECVREFVVERNLFRKRNTQYPRHTSLSVSGQAVAVRSNIFDLSGPGQARGPRGVWVRLQHESQAEYVMPADVRIWNNTCYFDGRTKGAGSCIHVAEAARRVDVRNNLLYDPSGRTTLLRDEAPDTQHCQAEGAKRPCNVASKRSPFVSASPSEFGTFAPAPGATGLDVGEPLLRVPINLERTDASLRGGPRPYKLDVGAFDTSPPSPAAR